MMTTHPLPVQESTSAGRGAGRPRHHRLRAFHTATFVAAVFLSGPTGVQGQFHPDLATPLRGELPPTPAPIFLPEPEGVAVTTFASGLQTIWSLEFAPDGRLFVSERPGRIRVVGPDGALDPVPWLELPDLVRRDDGMLGLALHPDFAEEPWVYVFHLVRKGDELVNRVSRFREVGGRAGQEEVLLDDLESTVTHNGGRLRFGPDGMLYVTLGDIDQPTLAQDLIRLHGSILRITPEGRVPADNPWPGSAIWAYGLRNTGGLAFRPADGALFAADHGPSSEWGPLRINARDEINIIVRGGNYGWPLAVGAPNHPAYVDPIIAWIPAQPPGDLTFYDGDLFPELKGDLLFTTLRGETMMRIRFTDPEEPDLITAVEWWFHNGELSNGSRFGRLRGLTVGPDGAIYIGTSNFGRAMAREGDDRILRIAPAPDR
jgi:glucose/arabinose dehydrogenase